MNIARALHASADLLTATLQQPTAKQKPHTM
eukprot:COSAG02_NODE_49127_length_329_cov_0.478261_1_plen_30_part_01